MGNTKNKQTNKERNELLEMIFESKQLCCDCQRPAPCACSPRMASPSRRCPGASGLMAGGMCSFLPLMSLPGASLAIFCASRICRVRGRSPALSTVKLKAVGSRLLAGCSSSRCRAMELASTLPIYLYLYDSIIECCHQSH